MTPLASVPGAVLLVGAGKMGGAMLEAWLARGLPPALLSVMDPAPSPEVAKAIAARRIGRDPQPQLIPNHAAIVLAVKPQTAPAVMPDVARFVGRDNAGVPGAHACALGWSGAAGKSAGRTYHQCLSLVESSYAAASLRSRSDSLRLPS